MHFCWFTSESKFVGKISSREEVGVVVPSDELVFIKTVGSIPSFFFSAFFPIPLKRSSVSNQYRLISLDVRPIKSKIRKIKIISSRSRTTVFGCFNYDLQKPAECSYGKVWPYNISLSKVLSWSKDYCSINIDQLSLSVRYSWSTEHPNVETSVLLIPSYFFVWHQYVECSVWLKWMAFVSFQIELGNSVYQKNWKSLYDIIGSVQDYPFIKVSDFFCIHFDPVL